MKIRPTLITVPSVLLSLALVMAGPLAAQTSHELQHKSPAAAPSGVHDFDFLMGHWRSKHRTLKARLAGSNEWIEFKGTMFAQKLMDGQANVDDNVFEVAGGTRRGVSLRSYDAETRQWSIWWLDSRFAQGPLEPPVRGSFRNGIGTFYADDMLDGKPIRVRFIWSNITATTAHWEQAFSPDGGKTWETNWLMDFERVTE